MAVPASASSDTVSKRQSVRAHKMAYESQPRTNATAISGESKTFTTANAATMKIMHSSDIGGAVSRRRIHARWPIKTAAKGQAYRSTTPFKPIHGPNPAMLVTRKAISLVRFGAAQCFNKYQRHQSPARFISR